ncbi:MAG: hypothetical protein ABEH86_12575 [Haloarcula sp.]
MLRSTFPENLECPEPVETDTQLSLLSSRYRRFLLYGLSLYTTPVSLAVLADTVTEMEYGVPAEEIVEKRVDVYTALYHNHLPQLVDKGVVHYNQSDDTVDLGPNASSLVTLLEQTVEKDIPDGHRIVSQDPIDLETL